MRSEESSGEPFPFDLRMNELRVQPSHPATPVRFPKVLSRSTSTVNITRGPYPTVLVKVGNLT